MTPTSKHYKGRVIVDTEDVSEIQADRDSFDDEYQFKLIVSSYRIELYPGEELQQLLDLGYSEKEGVAMLDAVEKVGRE